MVQESTYELIRHEDHGRRAERVNEVWSWGPKPFELTVVGRAYADLGWQ